MVGAIVTGGSSVSGGGWLSALAADLPSRASNAIDALRRRLAAVTSTSKSGGGGASAGSSSISAKRAAPDDDGDIDDDGNDVFNDAESPTTTIAASASSSLDAACGGESNAGQDTRASKRPRASPPDDDAKILLLSSSEPLLEQPTADAMAEEEDDEEEVIELSTLPSISHYDSVNGDSDPHASRVHMNHTAYRHGSTTDQFYHQQPTITVMQMPIPLHVPMAMPVSVPMPVPVPYIPYGSAHTAASNAGTTTNSSSSSTYMTVDEYPPTHPHLGRFQQQQQQQYQQQVLQQQRMDSMVSWVGDSVEDEVAMDTAESVMMASAFDGDTPQVVEEDYSYDEYRYYFDSQEAMDKVVVNESRIEDLKARLKKMYSLKEAARTAVAAEPVARDDEMKEDAAPTVSMTESTASELYDAGCGLGQKIREALKRYKTDRMMLARDSDPNGLDISAGSDPGAEKSDRLVICIPQSSNAPCAPIRSFSFSDNLIDQQKDAAQASVQQNNRQAQQTGAWRNTLCNNANHMGPGNAKTKDSMTATAPNRRPSVTSATQAHPAYNLQLNRKSLSQTGTNGTAPGPCQRPMGGPRSLVGVKWTWPIRTKTVEEGKAVGVLYFSESTVSVEEMRASLKKYHL